jgi:hypothetical protein
VIGTAGFTTCILEYLFLAFVVARLRGDMKLQFNLQVSERCSCLASFAFWIKPC